MMLSLVLWHFFSLIVDGSHAVADTKPIVFHVPVWCRSFLPSIHAVKDLACQYCVEMLSSSPQEIVISGIKDYIDKVVLELEEEASEFVSDLPDISVSFSFSPTWKQPTNTLQLVSVDRFSREWNDVEGKT